MTLSEYYETVYKPWKHGKAKPDTKKLHKTAINSLVRFLEREAEPSEITPQLLRDWGQWLTRRDFQIDTVRCYVSLVRCMARHANPSAWPTDVDAAWKSGSAGTLLDFLRNTYALERVVEPETIKQLEYCVLSFGRFIGRAPTAADLTSDNVNRFLIEYANGRKAETVKAKRRGLLTIWRAMYEAELIDHYPRRIRKLKPQRRIVIAWTPDDVQRLYTLAGELGGSHRKTGLPRSLFWQLLILLAYETGLRRGDCLDVNLSEIPHNGIFQRVQNKTGNVITCELSAQALKLVRRVVRLGVYTLGSVCGERAIGRQFIRLARKAGLCGSFKYIRRAGATAVEKVQAGAATKFLGHKTPGLAMQHYVDQSQLMVHRPKPPAIGGKGGDANG